MKIKLIEKNYFIFLYLIFCGKIFYTLFGDIDATYFKFNFFTKIYTIAPLNYILFLLIGLALKNLKKLN